MGLRPGRPPEDLIIDSPDLLYELEKSFVDAGSDIILTCTFGGTRMRMKDSKYQDRTPEVNIRAGTAAERCFAPYGVVILGIGALIKCTVRSGGESKRHFLGQAKAEVRGFR
jgi:5-methyltetrahydrofolate--homocysteine methyltransferase